nr:MAG: hypothetical protein ADFBMEEK_00082 [Peromyscus leucopus gammaherpesvirus]
MAQNEVPFSKPEAVFSHSWACVLPQEIDLNIEGFSRPASRTIGLYCKDFFDNYFKEHIWKLEQDRLPQIETKSQKRRKRRNKRKQLASGAAPPVTERPLQYTISFIESRIRRDSSKTLLLNVGSPELVLPCREFCAFLTLQLTTYVRQRILESGDFDYTAEGSLKAISEFHFYYVGNMLECLDFFYA